MKYRAKSKAAPTTLLEAVEKSLSAAARYHKGVEAEPACILWTDADGQWAPLISTLQKTRALPQTRSRCKTQAEPTTSLSTHLAFPDSSSYKIPSSTTRGLTIPAWTFTNEFRQTTQNKRPLLWRHSSIKLR